MNASPDNPNTDVTRLLGAIAAGDPTASADLLPLVYDELRRLAHSHLASEPHGHTLQPTALVHEAYLRLVGSGEVSWDSRAHFFGAAARAMRRILVDRARRVQALKRGGDLAREQLHENAAIFHPETPSPDAAPFDLVALDEALERLAARDDRQAEIVMLRYFAGLTIEETAAALDLSPATIKAEWTYARAWLRREVETRSRHAGGTQGSWP